MLGVFSGPDFSKIFLKNKHQLGSVKIFKSLKALVQWPGDFLKLDLFFRVKKKIIFNLAVKFMNKAKERIMSYRKINIDYVMTLALVNTKQERLLKKKKRRMHENALFFHDQKSKDSY